MCRGLLAQESSPIFIVGHVIMKEVSLLCCIEEINQSMSCVQKSQTSNYKYEEQSETIYRSVTFNPKGGKNIREKRNLTSVKTNNGFTVWQKTTNKIMW